jgi:TPR repeat protein
MGLLKQMKEEFNEGYREVLHGTPETEKHASTDVNALTAKAEAGDAEAQAELAMCYDAGESVTADQGKAFYWFGKAAVQGHGFAQLFMGNYYLHGKGTAKDEVKAFDWFQKAAETEPDGMAELGLCYLDGKGVQPDAKKGKELLIQAAARGSRVAPDEMKERGIRTPVGRLKICYIAGAVVCGLAGLCFGFFGLVAGAIVGAVAGGLVHRFFIAPE